MSDSGYMALRHLKDQRKKDMAKNFCHRFVQDVMKKYDTQNTGVLLVKKLQNQCLKHKPACIEHFNEKYIEIVQQIISKQHNKSGHIDKMQLYEQCNIIYHRFKKEERANKNSANFI